jgi:integrase
VTSSFSRAGFYFHLRGVSGVQAVPVRQMKNCLARQSGARLGELLGLQWKHIDFSAGELRIEQSLWNGKLVSPKAVSSTRNVPCAPRLLEELRKHREHSMSADSEDFVFWKSNGESLNSDVLRKDVLYPLLDRLHTIKRWRLQSARLESCKTAGIRMFHE